MDTVRWRPRKQGGYGGGGGKDDGVAGSVVSGEAARLMRQQVLHDRGVAGGEECGGPLFPGPINPRLGLVPDDDPGLSSCWCRRRGGHRGRVRGGHEEVGRRGEQRPGRGGGENLRGVVGEHPSKVGVRGDGARADGPVGAPVGAPVAAPVTGRRAGAVPVERDEGGRGRGMPGLRRRGVTVAGRGGKQAEAGGVGARPCGRKGVSDPTVRSPADGLVRVRRIGHHQRRRRKERDGAISTVLAVLVPFLGNKGS